MRFITAFAFFVVCAGLYQHSGANIHWLQWVGHLPGDLIIHKDKVAIYLPLTTSLLVSALCSLLLFRRKS